MKRLPILRWMLIAIVLLGVYILGLILFPVYYPLRSWIRRKEISFLWWFLNNDEKNEEENTYGDLKWRSDKGIVLSELNWIGRAIVAFRWIAIRNNSWNFRTTHFVPKLASDDDFVAIEIKKHTLGRNPINFKFVEWDEYGKLFIYYQINGVKYFRLTWTLNAWLFGKRVWNVQLGTLHKDQARYMYKSKFHKGEFIKAKLTILQQ